MSRGVMPQEVLAGLTHGSVRPTAQGPFGGPQQQGAGQDPVNKQLV